MDAFGIHSDLWKFLSTLLDLQEEQEMEEMLYEVGGKPPSKRSVGDRQKENQLSVLKELFDQNPVPVPLDVALNYVRNVSFKMRQYNNIDNCDADDAQLVL